MKLYYTSPTGSEAVQTKPQMSLGGYKSSTTLTNSQFENLFSDITNVTVQNFNQNQYVGLVLKNELGSDITGVKLWFEYLENSYSLFRVAAVDMSIDASENLQMEHISDMYSKPLNGEFFEADTVDNAVDLGDLIADEQIGIWIERELLTDVILEQQSAVYAPDPDLSKEGRFVEVVLPKFDEIKICISWS